MYTKEICHLTITIFCIFIFIQYTLSQPLLIPTYEDDNSISIKPSSDSESNDNSIPKLSFVHSEYNQINQPNSSEPIRRANFWKRANFWRKRANFWRREFSP